MPGVVHSYAQAGLSDWPRPEPVAALLVAAAAEVVLLELAAGKHDGLRRGLIGLATANRG